MSKIICVDFDGVLHAYTSRWEANDIIADGPVEGAMEWLIDMAVDIRYSVAIYSSRSRERIGIKAMREWIEHEVYPFVADLEELNEVMDGISFVDKKPPAFMTIDDRGYAFRGTFPSKNEINHFKTWYGK